MHSIDNNFYLEGKTYTCTCLECNGQKMKSQNKTMKHKSKHRVFLFFVKIKLKYLNNFIKTNLVQF